MVCEYARDKALTVNVLWDIAYGLHHEALCLDSLEDFNATEADLMSMKDDILAMWKSRDTRKTSSLRPTFVSTADSKSQGSTLGRTFIPGGATATSGALHGSGGGMGEASLPFFRPLAPPPGIPSTSGLLPYIQGLLPTSFSTVGKPMEYNFDPITGQPLKTLIPSTYSLTSQPLGASFITPTSPSITGLSGLPGLSQEECPLGVGSPSRSSQVVVGRRVPTVTVSSATAETTLLALPNTAPRISTSCSNMTGGDIHRVIWQHPHSPSNKTLAGAGVGRGSARRPAKWTAGRGQVLVNMLADKGGNKGWELAAKLEGNGAGRGQPIPSPSVGRPEQRGRQEDTHTKASLPQPSLRIWTTKVLQSLTLRQPLGHPGGLLSLPLNWQSATCALKWQPVRKRRRLLEPPLNEFRDKNERKRLLGRKGKSTSSAGSGDVMPGISWRRKELGSKRSTTVSEGPLEPVLTLLLTP